MSNENSEKMRKKKRKPSRWIIFARVLLVVQAVASVLLLVLLGMTKMIPAKFMIPAILAMVFAEFIVFALIYRSE